MDIKNLISLISDASFGIDNFNESTVGSNGYGFLYRDLRKARDPYVTGMKSGKVCGAGAHFGDFERFMTLEEIKFDKLSDIGGLMDDIKYDMLLAGSLKTLIPDLVFGGDERLFRVWMFIKTPDDNYFPATFYYGASGTALGGWYSENYKIFPKDFRELISCSPFDFEEEELTGLIEAQMFALKKVPVSDFCGIYRHDLGNALMCVHSGVAIIQELGYDYGEKEVEIVLDYHGYDFEQDKFNYKEIVKKAKKRPSEL